MIRAKLPSLNIKLYCVILNTRYLQYDENKSSIQFNNAVYHRSYKIDTYIC